MAFELWQKSKHIVSCLLWLFNLPISTHRRVFFIFTHISFSDFFLFLCVFVFLFWVYAFLKLQISLLVSFPGSSTMIKTLSGIYACSHNIFSPKVCAASYGSFLRKMMYQVLKLCKWVIYMYNWICSIVVTYNTEIFSRPSNVSHVCPFCIECAILKFSFCYKRRSVNRTQSCRVMQLVNVHVQWSACSGSSELSFSKYPAGF